MKDKSILLILFIALISSPVYAVEPSVNTVDSSSLLIEQYQNITIWANVTDSDGDLDKVFVNITAPNGSTNAYQMNLISADTYSKQYNGTVRGSYYYRVWGNDSAGNVNYSAEFPFYVVKFTTVSKTINVTVDIKVSCCGSVSYFYFPDPVIQNQTAVFLIFFQNCGNVQLDEHTTYLKIYNSTGNLIRSFSGVGDPAGNVGVGEENLYWSFWATSGNPIGDYTALAEVEYASTISTTYNVSYLNFTELNSTANCSAIVDNRSNCTTIEDKDCYLYVEGEIYDTTTNVTVNKTVDGMNNGTPVYKGDITLDSVPYNVYVFNMSNCDKYCYSCLSNDTEINSSVECAYEGSYINNTYEVYDVVDNGSSVSYRKVESKCDYMTKVSSCYIYENNSATCNETDYCSGSTRMEKKFEIVTQFGPQPSPETSLVSTIGPDLIIIRELPPQIHQNSNCDSENPWDTCTHTSNKIIVYNRGSENASNVSVTDTLKVGSCSIGNCSPLAYRCVSSGNYSCSTAWIDNRLVVNFNLTSPLFPLKYRILEYEIVPALDRSAYNGTASYYEFDANASFHDLSRVEVSNITYVANENDSTYNPNGSKRMELRNVSAFNFELDVDSSTQEEDREFGVNANSTFRVRMISLSGEDEKNSSWTAILDIPSQWSVTDCFAPSSDYSCSFNNTKNLLTFTGSKTPADMQFLDLWFTATTDTESIFLLSANKSLESDYENYIPGLFVASRYSVSRNITSIVNVTQPQPQPYPEFGPNLIIVRELPPQIYQSSDCNSADPWTNCTYTRNRLIIYNRGSENASCVSVTDTLQVGNCSIGNCSPVAYRCVSSTDYSCGAQLVNNKLTVNFNLTDSLNPQHYIVLEYEIVPALDRSAYNGTASYYEFDANASFHDLSRVEVSNITYVANENDSTYNPNGSKRMELRNVSAFNFELDVDPSTTAQDREFSINSNTTFRLRMTSLSGEDERNEPWNSTIYLQKEWIIGDCLTPSRDYSCSLDNDNNLLTFTGSKTPADMQSLDFWFTAQVDKEGIYLLSVNKSLDGDYERYIPGLFAVSRLSAVRNITENVTEEVNVTQNVTEPQPSPEFGPNLIIIRELPPDINQKAGCSSANPWDTCIYTENRLIIYNRGIRNASLVNVRDRMSPENCSITNCSPIAYRCVSSNNYSCTTQWVNNSLLVDFNFTSSIKPGDYRIMGYELVPVDNSDAYTGKSYYRFNATTSFKDLGRTDVENITYIAQENDDDYNPAESKLMRLRNVSAFNFDINTDSGIGKRDFYTLKNATFNLTMISLSGNDGSSETWYTNISIPNSWDIMNCSVPSLEYECSFNNSRNILVFNGSTTPEGMDSIDFQFTASTNAEAIYLLPINKSLNDKYEAYVPGLFIISRLLSFENITEIMNITQNITQNITLPQPEPEVGPYVEFAGELPPDINQDIPKCDDENPWLNCTYSSNRIIIHNIGMENSTHVRIEDVGKIGSCSIEDCSPVSYRCADSQEYICKECRYPIKISDLTLNEGTIALAIPLDFGITVEGKFSNVTMEMFSPANAWENISAYNTEYITPNRSRYSFTYTPSISGEYLYRFRIRDDLGFSTYSDAYSFTDITPSSTAPNITGIDIIDLVDINRTIIIDVNITEPDADLSNVYLEVFKDGTALRKTISISQENISLYSLSSLYNSFLQFIGLSAANDYSYHYVYEANESGTYLFRINAVDAAGNSVFSNPYTIEDECTLNENESSKVVFNLKESLPPGGYKILEYEFIPVNNGSAYTGTNISYYYFNTSIDYYKYNYSQITYQNYDGFTKGVMTGLQYVVGDDASFNTPNSTFMLLGEFHPFDYDIKANSGLGRRDFYTGENTSFNLSVTPLSGTGEIDELWNLKILLPESWNVSECSTPSIDYLCSFSNTDHLMNINGLKTPANMKTIDFRLTARTDIEDTFLLPINKSLSYGGGEAYEPGLFLLSRPIEFKNLTEETNVTQNVTEEVQKEVEKEVQKEVQKEVEKEVEKEVQKEVQKEKPENVTKPELLELAINIEPVEREVSGRQGEFIPVEFTITNIGTIEAYNITLIPLVPEGWEYKEAVVSFLNVSESLNRTLFVKAPYTVTGIFAIPVNAIVQNLTLDTDYFQITIYESKERYLLQIVEMPRKITIQQGLTNTIPILIENTGKAGLHDITGRLENAEACIERSEFGTIRLLESGETDSIRINLDAKDKSIKCDAIVIIGSNEKAYTFSNIEIILTPPPSLIPPASRINILLLLTVFFGILIAARLSRVKLVKKRRKKRLSIRIFVIGVYLILAIIVFMTLYWAYNYFNIPAMLGF